MGPSRRNRQMVVMRETGIRYAVIARGFGITPAYWRTLIERRVAGA